MYENSFQYSFFEDVLIVYKKIILKLNQTDNLNVNYRKTV